MKTINVTFEDEEYQRLKKKKGKLSWHDFIMALTREDDGGNKSSNR
jgi:predicted CopG family antitoxin